MAFTLVQVVAFISSAILIALTLQHGVAAVDVKTSDGETVEGFTPNEKFYDIAVLTSGNFSKVVMNSQETWVIIVHDGTMARSWKTMAASSRGIFWLGMIDKTKQKNFLDSLDFGPETVARVYPHGNHYVKTKRYIDVKTPMEARQVAVKEIPNKVPRLDTVNLEGFLLDSYSSSPSRFPAIILTGDAVVSGLYKALAIRFDKYFNFMYLANPTTSDIKTLGIQSLFFEFPTIIILIYRQDKSGENKGTHMDALAFDRHTMGDLDYPHIVEFLFSVNNQYRYTLPGDNKSNRQEVAQMLDVVEIERQRFTIKDEHYGTSKIKPMKEMKETKTEKAEEEEVVEPEIHEHDKILRDVENLKLKPPQFDEDGEMIFGDGDDDEVLQRLMADTQSENVKEEDLLLNDFGEKHHFHDESHDEL